MTTTEPMPITEVTQADREAIERFIREDAPLGMKMMFGGDPAWKLAQSFARHRLTALADAERKLEEARGLLAAWNTWSCGQQGASPFQETRAFLATQDNKETAR